MCGTLPKIFAVVDFCRSLSGAVVGDRSTGWSVVTLMPDGQPQALLTWIDTDAGNLLVNTEPKHQRSMNIRRDPRVTVLLHSSDDPWDWAEVRRHVVATTDGQEARNHIDELSRFAGTRRAGSPFRSARPSASG